MARITKHVCDIKGCENEVKKHKNEKMHVLFTTEQNEGRPTIPYLFPTEIDLCEEHFEFMIHTRQFVSANGAQGFNTYYFKHERRK